MKEKVLLERYVRIKVQVVLLGSIVSFLPEIENPEFGTMTNYMIKQAEKEMPIIDIEP